jgi:hypothetical protein
MRRACCSTGDGTNAVFRLRGDAGTDAEPEDPGMSGFCQQRERERESE